MDGSEILYIGVLLSVLSHESIFEVVREFLLIPRFISVGYHYLSSQAVSRKRILMVSSCNTHVIHTILVYSITSGVYIASLS